MGTKPSLVPASRGSSVDVVEWPDSDRETIYIPPDVIEDAPDAGDLRARLGEARLREGLSADDRTLDQLLQSGYAVDPQRRGIYTESEQQDVFGDHDRVEAARAVLAGAEDVFGDLQVCWCNGRRGVRVLLTGDLDHYRRLLSEVIDPARVVVEHTALTEAELTCRGDEVRAQSEQLAAKGIFLTSSGYGLEGFEIEYLAVDFARADRILRRRFGDFATIHYRGATNHTFRPMPFGSWLAEEDRLHVFYALHHNGEAPGGCQVFETDTAVVVALTIKDWRGARTLVGGFTPSHATVQLRRPVGDRDVIDDAHNRARPHWSKA